MSDEMRDKAKAFCLFGNLFMTMLACFLLGGYASSTLRHGETVELYRWFGASVFGSLFLVKFLMQYRGEQR